MNLLADLYSTIDSKKRQLKGLLSDPVETIYQGIRNIGQDWNGLLDTQAQAYPFIPRTKDQQARIQAMARTPEQARKELADQGANMGIAAATVWHGSPHKFNKFDSSKIGTGEGAQAYGHGLYLAESPGVASTYKTFDPREWWIGNQKIDPSALKGAEKQAWNVATLAKTNGKNPMEYASQLMDEGKMSLAQYGRVSKYANAELRDPTGGNMYKVDLPDEAIAKMVDYDKPFSSQPKEFRDMLAKYDPETYHPSGSDYDANELGQQTLQRLQKQWGETKVSAVLKGSGIPGIRYLDGGSRGAGSGTSNYVIFPGNESLLTILERNGQPVGLLD